MPTIPSVINYPVKFTQPVQIASLVLPEDCVTDDAVNELANIAATKLQHQHQQMYSQTATATAAAGREIIHVVIGSEGTLVSFAAGSRTACTGNATITVDLYKNGSSILSETVVINSEAGTYSLVWAAGFDDDVLAAGDVLEIVVAVAAGSGALGTGVYGVLTVHESAQ